MLQLKMPNCQQYREGQQEDILEQDKMELHAQVSFDGPKQYSDKFSRNVQLLSTETAEGTKISLGRLKLFKPWMIKL